MDSMQPETPKDTATEGEEQSAAEWLAGLDLPDEAPRHDRGCEGCRGWALVYRELISLVGDLKDLAASALAEREMLEARLELATIDLKQQLAKVRRYEEGARSGAAYHEDDMLGGLHPRRDPALPLRHEDAMEKLPSQVGGDGTGRSGTQLGSPAP